LSKRISLINKRKNYSIIGIYKTGHGGFEHIIPDTNDPEN
jgi:hypothetical protein